MPDWLDRETLLLSQDQIQRLSSARACVVGLGGVGGACAEALVRAGIGNLMLIDHDTVDITNCNRQLLATRDVIGQKKCDVAMRRFLSINPALNVTARAVFFAEENSSLLFEYRPDFIADAIDTVTAKLALITRAREEKTPLISCFGTGNKLDPTLLRIGDLADTAGSGCPIARIMRRKLKEACIEHLPVVYSVEPPKKAAVRDDSRTGRHSPGSISFVPPVAGYLQASYIIRSLLRI